MSTLSYNPTDVWVATWTGASFAAILFTGMVALFGISKVAREKRDDRAARLIERFNSGELDAEFKILFPYGDADLNKAYVERSLLPIGHPLRNKPVDGFSGPLAKPSEILRAALRLYNWLEECILMHERKLATPELVIEVGGLAALSFIYVFDHQWSALQNTIGTDLRKLRRFALKAQWQFRKLGYILEKRLLEFSFFAG